MAQNRVIFASPVPFFTQNPTKSSVDYEAYVRGYRALGYDSYLVCPDGSECSPEVPHRIVPPGELINGEFWKAQEAEALILINWMMHAPIIQAMKESGSFVISRADSDGEVTVRSAPVKWFRLLVQSKPGLVNKLRGLKHFLFDYFLLHRARAETLLRSIEACDRVAIETRIARENVRKFLSLYGKEAWIEKFSVCPNLIRNEILEYPLPNAKQPRVVAIGRWNSPQKDAPLLRNALHHFLQRHPNTEITIIGAHGETEFASLLSRYPSVKCPGIIPPEAVRPHLADASVLILSSLWEGSHISSHEAVCMGCTIVGPSITPIPDLIDSGRFGTLALNRKPATLAKALETEMNLWQSGQRDPQSIATHWRHYLNTERILRQIIADVPNLSPVDSLSLTRK